MDFLSGIKETLILAVKSTGKMLLSERHSGDFRFIESPVDPITGLHSQYDIISNKFLLKLLLPDLCLKLKTDELLIISEESDNIAFYFPLSNSFVDAKDISQYKGYVLVVDPICGTIPFVRGVPDFVISLAVMKNMQCIASIVYQPNLEELFYAEAGKGATLNNTAIEASSSIRDLEHAYISIEHRVYRNAPPGDIHEIANRVMRIRTAGTCALEMCYVACGRLDGLIKLNQSFYDYLPGSLFMQEAGRQNSFVTLDGITPILPLHSLNKRASFLATNGYITQDLAYYTQKWIP